MPRLKTARRTAEALAKAAARRLEAGGYKFPAIFPYNRFEHERSPWWLSFKGSPAFSAAKLYFRHRDRGFECGMVLEKGYEGEAANKKQHRLDDSWDWHRYTPLMKQASFQSILEHLGPVDGRVHISAHPPVGRASERLTFSTSPWDQLDHKIESKGTQPLATVVENTGLPDLITRLQGNPSRAWWWYDLYIGAPVEIVAADESRFEFDDEIVDEVLLPLAEWLWPTPCR